MRLVSNARKRLMANNVVCLHSSWQLAADASDRIGELMTEIPGWKGYECSVETQAEMRRATALLQEAIPLLEQASEREERRRIVGA
jgi:ABC-type antimicrobial peptide transport system ATPase subunit